MIKLKSLLTEAKGDCYQAAGRLIINFMGDKNARLVHGMVHGQGSLTGFKFGHAWVEYGGKCLDHSNGKKQEIPKTVYYAVGRIHPRECKYYKPRETTRKMMKHKHWGPWDMTGATVKSSVYGDTELQEDIPDIRGEIGIKRQRIPTNILDKLDD